VRLEQGLDSAAEAPSGLEGEPFMEGITLDRQPTTGRWIMTTRDSAPKSVDNLLKKVASSVGVKRVCRARDYESSGIAAEESEAAEAVVLDDFGIVILNVDPEQRIAATEMVDRGPGDVVMEPEQYKFAASSLAALSQDLGVRRGYPAGREFWAGYEAGVRDVIRKFDDGDYFARQPAPDSGYIGTTLAAAGGATWGLQAIGAVTSRFSGQGVRVAVLDTGFSFQHPDFASRSITNKSFVPGESAEDGNGHGTHCAGTACGPVQPTNQPRYGVAYNAELFVGKVLNNRGRGADGQILQGMIWALQQGCRVISMSIQSMVLPGQGPSYAYEEAAKRILRAGGLVIAAAGNYSSRPSVVYPVASPANCPSVLAVAAIDAQMEVARFSNRAVNASGGELNLAAPGVDVFSSYRLPQAYRSLQGTSMATPHVSGIAALVVEEDSGRSGLEVYQRMKALVRPLRHSVYDVGNGLAQAPA
jgi:subtilisin family serine protease